MGRTMAHGVIKKTNGQMPRMQRSKIPKLSSPVKPKTRKRLKKTQKMGSYLKIEERQVR